MNVQDHVDEANKVERQGKEEHSKTTTRAACQEIDVCMSHNKHTIQ